MSVTNEDLASWLNVDAANPVLPDLLVLAGDLVNDYLGVNTDCPESIRDFAVREVASRAYDRFKSPNGAVQFGPQGEVFYASADLLAGVKPSLKRYKPLEGAA